MTPMDDAARQMVDWVEEVMPDATPEGFARKFAEEAGELLGFKIDLPEGWSIAWVDTSEARDCALVLVAISHLVGESLGESMVRKVKINRSRHQYLQPDGTYHHKKSVLVKETTE